MSTAFNRNGAGRHAALLIAVFFTAVAGHVLQILLFSHSMPFGDQWDSEAFFVFKPWIEGRLDLSLLLLPHNEHQIVWKKLFDILVFEINGRHWDNRVIALANTVFYAATLTLLCHAALRSDERWTRRMLLALCFVLPFTTFAYENTLWGFQSPFPMLTLLVAYCCQIGSAETFSLRNAMLLIGLCLAALFTMASGLLLAPVAAALLATQRDAANRRAARIAFVVLALALGIGAYLALPQLEHHAAFRAQSAADFASAALRLLSWPVPSAPLLWLPFLFWALFSAIYRERPSRADRCFGALALWGGLQAAALAYGRGHDMAVVPSRYIDLLLLPLIANGYFLGRLLRHPRVAIRPRLPLRVLMSLAAVVTAGFGAVEWGRSLLVSHYKHSLWQANHELTAAMLSGFDPSDTNFALAYPVKERLVTLLADPAVRTMLGVIGTRLPSDCDVPATARLSRLACLGRIGDGRLPEFERAAAPATLGTLQCAIDRVDGLDPGDGAPADPSVPLRFIGWVGPGAADVRGLGAPASLRLTSDDATFVAQSYWRHARPDVAEALHDSAYAWSGFHFVVSTRNLPPARYRVELVQGDRHCVINQSLQVR